jgi:hypothetical protein
VPFRFLIDVFLSLKRWDFFFVTGPDSLGNLYDSLGNLRGSLANLRDSLANLRDSLANLHDSLGNLHDSLGNLRDFLGNLRGSLANLRASVADEAVFWAGVLFSVVTRHDFLIGGPLSRKTCHFSAIAWSFCWTTQCDSQIV